MDPVHTTSTTPPTPSPPAPPDPIDAREASDFTDCFLRRQAELAALAQEDIVPLNLDVRTTVATVLGALHKLEPYKAQLAALPFVNHTYCAGLEDYAGALWHAHGRFVGSTPAAEAIAPLYQEGFALRETLFADLKAIVHRGILDAHCLDRIKGLSGYMNVAADLSGLAETLTGCFGKLEGRTLIQQAEITRARTLGEQLVRAFAVRERSSASAEVTATRQRAFTLVVRAYEEVRRAMTFLRWYEQDADTITPSLYAGRGNGHTKTGGGAPSSDAPAPSATDASAPVNEPAPVVPGGPGGDPLTN